MKKMEYKILVNWWLMMIIILCSKITRSQLQCRKVNSKQIHCLTPSTSDFILIECPLVHTIRILEAILQRSSTVGCPTGQGHGSTDCFHSNVTGVALSQCSPGSSSTCRVAFSFPSSSSVGCEEQSFPGNYYVAVTYRCQPEFSMYLNGSAWAISLCESDIRNGSLLNINSDVSGLLGNYIYNSSCSMSLLLPRYTDATIRANFFYKKPRPATPCDQHIEFQEVLEDSSPENVIVVCGSEDPAVSVACSAKDRSFRVKYVTNNNSVGVIFVLQVQANYETLMRIQGGNPPSEAIIVDSQETTTTTTTATSITSTGSPSITGSGGHESTTPNPLAPMLSSSGQSVTRVQLIGIIVGCVIAAVIIVLVIVIAVCARGRRMTKVAKLSSSRPDQNSGTAGDANARTTKISSKKDEVTEVYGVKGGENNFSYVTECYVDGNQTSRLVVPTKQTIKTVFDV